MSVEIKTERCWRIIEPDGREFDDDGVPHFDTQTEAEAAITSLNLQAGCTVDQFPKPCVSMTCDDCEIDLGGDDAYAELHLESIDQAYKIARESDWKLAPTGDFCWDCPVSPLGASGGTPEAQEGSQ